MKHPFHFDHLFLGLLLFSLSMTSAKAQQAVSFPKLEQVPSFQLKIAPNKTTSLIFPFPILGADLGSRDLIMKKATGARNVLWLKAVRCPFPPTSLCVITAGGRLYSFLVWQDDHPSSISFTLSSPSSPDDLPANLKGQPNDLPFAPQVWPAIITPTMNQARILACIPAVKKAKKTVFGCSARQEGIRLKLTGVYIYRTVLFFRLIAGNETALPYSVANLGFSVRERSTSRRTATQQQTIHPIFQPDRPMIIGPHQVRTWVVALPQLTLDRRKRMIIEMLEENGSRDLVLRVHPGSILQAAILRPMSR